MSEQSEVKQQGPFHITQDLFFRVGGYSGLDLLLHLLPQTWQARVVGYKLVRGPYKGVDLKKTRLLVCLPGGVYRVLNKWGKVEPAQSGAMPPAQG